MADRVTEMLDQRLEDNALRASNFPPNRNICAHPPSLVLTTNESEKIQRQRECKQRLEIELENEKKRLKLLQRELEAIREPLPAHAVETLTQVIQQLRNHCKQMTQEIDEVGPSYALRETDQEFYANADSQRLSIHRAHSLPLSRNRTPPPPIPAALRSKLNRNVLNQVQQQPPAVSPDLSSPNTPSGQETVNGENGNGPDEDDEEAGWVCNMCTFKNNCLLTKCEQCDMPFLPIGNRNATNSIVFMQMQQQQYL